MNTLRGAKLRDSVTRICLTKKPSPLFTPESAPLSAILSFLLSLLSLLSLLHLLQQQLLHSRSFGRRSPSAELAASQTPRRRHSDPRFLRFHTFTPLPVRGRSEPEKQRPAEHGERVRALCARRTETLQRHRTARSFRTRCDCVETEARQEW